MQRCFAAINRNLLLGLSQKLPRVVNYIVKVYWELLDSSPHGATFVTDLTAS